MSEVDVNEFPEGKYSKITKKIGWIFSPLLLISLIAFTVFTAQGLKVNFEEGRIEKKGSVEIKGLEKAKVFINDNLVGTSPDVFDTTITSPNEISLKVEKSEKRDWVRKVKPKIGFVKTFYPIMYPKNIEFGSPPINAQNTYTSVKDPSFFFYEINGKDGSILLYKYSVSRQVFGVKENNNLFADITKFITETSSESGESIPTKITKKQYSILPNNDGTSFILIIPNESVYVFRNNELNRLANIVPDTKDSFYWSDNGNYIIYKTKEDIYSVEISTNKLLVIHRSTEKDEKLDIQFTLDDTLIYKLSNGSRTDLVQNSYSGNDRRTIEIPNVNNIRKNAMQKVYNFLPKQNLLLIQTETDIYSYNVVSYELKKFNLFKGEKILYIDNEEERILTMNLTNPKQFRFYDVYQNESRTFTIEKDVKHEPLQTVVFNNGNNLALTYPGLVILSDIDGFNQVMITNFTEPELILASKIDNNVQVAIRESAVNLNAINKLKPSATQPLTPSPEEFLSITPSPSISTTPAPIQPEQLKYVIKIEKFKN